MLIKGGSFSEFDSQTNFLLIYRRYYSYGLEKKFRPEIYKDFQNETLKDYASGKYSPLYC